MKKRCLQLAFIYCLVPALTVIAEVNEITVNSYYGKYDSKQKKSGVPSESLKGPVKEIWKSPVPHKNYHIGVMFPTMKDPYWVTANYGIISYAKKMGIRLTPYSAEGYVNFGNQRDQLTDLAEKKKVDGIIIASVNYKYINTFVEKVSDSGIPVIGMINDINTSAIKAKAMVSYYDAGYKAGEFVVNDSLGKNIKVAFFPGPEQSGWAEDMYKGFLEAVTTLKKKGQTITISPPYYGDTRPNVQRLRLSFFLHQKENGNIDYIIGNAVAAIEAVKYRKEHKTIDSNIKIVSTYITAPVYNYIKSGDIEAAPYDQPLAICRIALDMIVNILNGKQAGVDFPFRAGPEYIMITKENVGQYTYEQLFGPMNFKPVLNSKP